MLIFKIDEHRTIIKKPYHNSYNTKLNNKINTMDKLIIFHKKLQKNNFYSNPNNLTQIIIKKPAKSTNKKSKSA